MLGQCGAKGPPLFQNSPLPAWRLFCAGTRRTESPLVQAAGAALLGYLVSIPRLPMRGNAWVHYKSHARLQIFVSRNAPPPRPQLPGTECNCRHHVPMGAPIPAFHDVLGKKPQEVYLAQTISNLNLPGAPPPAAARRSRRPFERGRIGVGGSEGVASLGRAPSKTAQNPTFLRLQLFRTLTEPVVALQYPRGGANHAPRTLPPRWRNGR